jgi:hypothetical protein
VVADRQVHQVEGILRTVIALDETENNSAVPGEAEQQKRLAEVRSQISDIGYEIDAGKAVMALTVGGGTFLALLGLLAAYDFLSGRAGIYAPLGITRDTLKWIAIAGCVLGAAALSQALMRRKVRDRNREAELARLEDEYARLQSSESEKTEP